MKKTILYEGRIITLTIEDDWSELNVEDITRIDYANIVGELFTSHLMLNKVGLLKAEVENRLRKIKLKLSLAEAKFSTKYRKESTYEEYNSARRLVKKKPVQSEIDDACTQDNNIYNLRKDVATAKGDLAIVENIYWACKSKDDKLKLFERHLSPEDMQVDKLTSNINDILIKVHKSKLHE